jgi:putative NADH-flavin reductase
MKRIALIGATGFVGSHIMKELLSRGYPVTAIARSTADIKLEDGNLRKIELDVTNTEKLTSVIEDSDVVISAFNGGWSNPNIYQDFLNGYKSIEKAVRDSNVDRYIVIGGAGSLYIDGKQIVDGPDFPDQFKGGATAARDYLTALKKEEDIDWTYFSPAIDMGPHVKTGRTGKYRLGKDEPVFDGNGESVLSVEDLAVVIADEVENHKFSRQRFTAGY